MFGEKDFRQLNRKCHNVILQRAGGYSGNNDSIVVTGRTLSNLVTKNSPLQSLKTSHTSYYRHGRLKYEEREFMFNVGR